MVDLAQLRTLLGLAAGSDPRWALLVTAEMQRAFKSVLDPGRNLDHVFVTVTFPTAEEWNHRGEWMGWACSLSTDGTWHHFPRSSGLQIYAWVDPDSLLAHLMRVLPRAEGPLSADLDRLRALLDLAATGDHPFWGVLRDAEWHLPRSIGGRTYFKCTIVTEHKTRLADEKAAWETWEAWARAFTGSADWSLKLERTHDVREALIDVPALITRLERDDPAKPSAAVPPRFQES